MPIKLEIYLKDNEAEATGLLYVDDGLTFKYRDIREKIYVKFGFNPINNTLWTQNTLDPMKYWFERGAKIKIVQVEIYGLDFVPEDVITA